MIDIDAEKMAPVLNQTVENEDTHDFGPNLCMTLFC
jgi:methanogenic corrinoid protein MtbC1